jgi:molybdopterin converting factor small subunit
MPKVVGLLKENISQLPKGASRSSIADLRVRISPKNNGIRIMKLKLSCGRSILFSEIPEKGPVRLKPVLQSVKDSHPQIYQSWCEGDGKLRESLPVFVNGEHIRYKEGMETKLHNGDEVYIVPLITGG